MWFFTACLNGACAVAQGKKKKKKVHADTKQKRRCKLLIGGVRSFFASELPLDLKLPLLR